MRFQPWVNGCGATVYPGSPGVPVVQAAEGAGPTTKKTPRPGLQPTPPRPGLHPTTPRPGLQPTTPRGVNAFSVLPFVNPRHPGYDHFQWSYPGLIYCTLLGCVQSDRASPGIQSKHGPQIGLCGPRWGAPVRSINHRSDWAATVGARTRPRVCARGAPVRSINHRSGYAAPVGAPTCQCVCAGGAPETFINQRSDYATLAGARPRQCVCAGGPPDHHPGTQSDSPDSYPAEPSLHY
ncbi:hypothetical protein APED_10805 [Acanthopleuribacter pedis]